MIKMIRCVSNACFMGLACFVGLVVQTNFSFASTSALDLVIKTAPIVPHGLIAGAPLDVTISFVDLDPAIAGIDMKKGGTATVKLPPEIVNTGFPVARPTTAKGCEPPVLARCSSGGFLHGWPQGPILPLNEISYDEATHSLVLTANADNPPYSLESPGAKLIHLFTFGFKNPDTPGEYPISLVIRPNPDSDDELSGTAMLAIASDKAANIAIDSTQGVHVKGPHYRNTMYQSLKPGQTSLNMSANLWNTSHEPIVGASISMTSAKQGNIQMPDGSVIGQVKLEAPGDAKGFYLLSAPSFATKTGLAGFPTGRLVSALKTAPKAQGKYSVTFSLNDGNSIEHVIRVN